MTRARLAAGADAEGVEEGKEEGGRTGLLPGEGGSL